MVRMYDLIIRDGLVVTDQMEVRCDIAVSRGIIVRMGDIDTDEAQNIFDASGKYVFPGAVDAHTHLDLVAGDTRVCDDFASGTRAALAGGTTTIIDHVAFDPANNPPSSQIAHYHELAKGKAVIDYSFHAAIQYVNKALFQDLEQLRRQGISSVKAYTTYDYHLSDNDLMRLFAYAKEASLLVTVHAEDHQMIERLRNDFAAAGMTSPIYHALSRPNDTEVNAVRRVLQLAKAADDAPVYFVHISTKESLNAIRAARLRGQKNIYAETCPQYLLLTNDRYLEANNGGLKYIMSPPLRGDEDQDELWRALELGDIQVVATDHCPFFFDPDKLKGRDDFRRCPGGAPGVEERVLLLFSEGVMKDRLSLRNFAKLLMVNPAKLFGIYPCKGTLSVGSDADILVIDPNENQRLSVRNCHGSTDYCLYEGMNIQGAVAAVFSKGRLVCRQGNIYAKEGDGAFLKRELFSPKSIVW